MAFDITAELLLGGVWVDITEWVRYAPGITVDRGRGDEYATVPPSRATLQLDNRDGRFSPLKADGPYYDLLTLNTPIRIRETSTVTTTTIDTFGRTTSDSFGTSDLGLVWGEYRGSVTQYATTGSAATMTVASAPDFARASLLDRGWINVTAYYGEFTIPAPTGAALEPSLLWHFTPANSTYYFLRASVATTGVVTATIRAFDTALTEHVLATAVVAGLTHSAASPIKIEVTHFGAQIEGRVWQGSTRPSAATVTAESLDGAPVGGLIGVRFGRATANTNVAAQCAVDNVSATLDPDRLVAEVPAWPVEWDISESDVIVPIAAAGIGERLLAPSDPAQDSAIKGEILNPVRTGRVAYWPMEDGSSALTFASAVTGAPPLTAIGPVTAASYSDWVASRPICEVQDTGYLRGQVPAYTETTQTLLRFFAYIPAGAVPNDSRLALLETTGSASVSVWTDEDGNLLVKANSNSVGSAEVYASAPVVFALEDREVSISLSLVQDGADIDYTIGVYYIATGTATQSTNTITSQTVGRVHGIRMCDSASFSDVAIGHVFLGNDVTAFDNTASALRAWVGEAAGLRAYRLCQERNIQFEWVGNLDTTTPMGPQTTVDWRTALRQAVDADGGILYEPRGALGLALRTRASQYNQDPCVALTYGAAGEVSHPLRNTYDASLVRNAVRVTRTDGSSATAVQEIGRRSILPPPAGVGPYADDLTLNVDSDDQLADIAAWRRHIGTWDEPRFPLVNLDLRRLLGESKTSLLRDAARLDVGDRFTIADPPVFVPYDDISQLGQGFGEFLTPHQWRIGVNAVPEGPWQVGVLDSATNGLLGAANATLHGALASGGTTAWIATGGDERAPTLWSTTSEPYVIRIGGEDITVTAMATNAAAYGAAGAVSHGDNATLAPALPAGTSAGRLLVCVSVIRNTSATAALPDGYTTLADADNLRVSAKIHTGTESAPSCTFSGGAAGDTTSAVVIDLADTQLRVVAAAPPQANASAANIATPALAIDRNNMVVLTVVQKADDWTGASGGLGTEAVDSSTTTGNDQGIAVYYSIQTTATAVAAGTVTISGGANAVSKAVVLALDGSVQTATVTRTIAKAHAHGGEIQLKNAMRLAL